MPHHGGGLPIPQRIDQRQGIAHQIEEPERDEIAVIVVIPACGAAVTALVRCDDVVTRVSQVRHDLAPAVGEFGETVQQQKARPVLAVIPGFEDMHAQTVDIFDEPRPNFDR